MSYRDDQNLGIAWNMNHAVDLEMLEEIADEIREESRIANRDEWDDSTALLVANCISRVVGRALRGGDL